jgi:hypothetical protein
MYGPPSPRFLLDQPSVAQYDISQPNPRTTFFYFYFFIFIFESEFISRTCTYRHRSGHLAVLQSKYV